MAYRKKTIRTMLPTTRKVARLIAGLESVERKLKNLIPELEQLELDSRALYNQKKQAKSKDTATNDFLTGE